MSVKVLTFGCRLNQNEGAEIKKHALDSGLNNVVIFNSCAVTNEAERQLRQSIRKSYKQNPEQKIIVTGCAAQIDPQKYAMMPEVFKVIGNIEKINLSSYGFLNQLADTKILVEDIMSVKETTFYTPESIEDRARAFLQIQNGCNHECTFCIIPQGRGKSRSVPLGELVNHAKILVEKGFGELVLTGVDITDYGLDLPSKISFTQMLQRLLYNVPSISRLRISSIDVAELNQDFIDFFAAEKRIMPHLHLSLQSGDNMILKRMKRRHCREDVIRFCKKIIDARPETKIGADIITGFPTETEEMFNNTVDLVNQLSIKYLHVFPYSAKIGTPAAKMPQVKIDIRKARAAILREIGLRHITNDNRTKIGTICSVLLEKNSQGRTEDFSLVKVSHTIDDELVGKIVKCHITKMEDGNLIGQLL